MTTRADIETKLREFDEIGEKEFLKKYPKNNKSYTTWLIYEEKLYPVKSIWFSAQFPYDGGKRLGKSSLNSRHAEKELKNLKFITHRGFKREDLERYLKERKIIEPQFEQLRSATDDLHFDDISNDDPKYREIISRVVIRDDKVRRRVIERANGLCEYGSVQVPDQQCSTFIKRDGKPYLEAHHVLKLAGGGKDEDTNVIALCANHHREAHSGISWEALNERFQTIIDEKLRK